MTNIDIAFPPEGKEIYISLRESNGEHITYSCIYMGMGIFKFLSNGEQWACEVIKNGSEHKLYLIGKPIIGWWIPKKKKGEYNE